MFYNRIGWQKFLNEQSYKYQLKQYKVDAHVKPYKNQHGELSKLTNMHRKGKATIKGSFLFFALFRNITTMWLEILEKNLNLITNKHYSINWFHLTTFSLSIFIFLLTYIRIYGN